MKDPIRSLSCKQNLYLYGDANPLLNVDPLGYFSVPSLKPGVWVCLGCVVGHLGIAGGTCVTECLRPSMGWQWIKDCFLFCIRENFGEWLWRSIGKVCGPGCLLSILPSKPIPYRPQLTFPPVPSPYPPGCSTPSGPIPIYSPPSFSGPIPLYIPPVYAFPMVHPIVWR